MRRVCVRVLKHTIESRCERSLSQRMSERKLSALAQVSARQQVFAMATDEQALELVPRSRGRETRRRSATHSLSLGLGLGNRLSEEADSRVERSEERVRVR